MNQINHKRTHYAPIVADPYPRQVTLRELDSNIELFESFKWWVDGGVIQSFLPTTGNFYAIIIEDQLGQRALSLHPDQTIVR